MPSINDADPAARHNIPVSEATPTAGPRLFTRAHADSALVYLRPIVEEIQVHYRRVVGLRERLSMASYSELPEVERSYDREMDRLGELVDELHHAGVELRDFEGGLLAFAGLWQGRRVTLLWQADADTPFGLPLPARAVNADASEWVGGVTHMLSDGAPLSEAQPLPRAA